MNIQKCCDTCLYRATHEKCDGCLGNNPAVDLPDGSTEYRFDYKNWVASSLGEALERIYAMEASGARNIVIGGQGEAEVNAKWTAKEAFAHLYRVSCECGYMTYRPVSVGDEEHIRIFVHVERILVWKSGVFDRIEKPDGKVQWSRHPGFLRTQLSKDAYDMPGTPKELMGC